MAPRGCLGVWRGDWLIQRERTWGLLRIPDGPGDNEFRNHGTCGRKAFGTSWFSLLPAEPEVSLAASLSARPGGEPGQRGPQASDLPPAIPAAFCGLSYRTDRGGQDWAGRARHSLTTMHRERRPSPHFQDSQSGSIFLVFVPPPLWETTGSVQVWRTPGLQVATEASSPGQQAPATLPVPGPEAAFPSFQGTPSLTAPLSIELHRTTPGPAAGVQILVLLGDRVKSLNFWPQFSLPVSADNVNSHLIGPLRGEAGQGDVWGTAGAQNCPLQINPKLSKGFRGTPKSQNSPDKEEPCRGLCDLKHGAAWSGRKDRPGGLGSEREPRNKSSSAASWFLSRGRIQSTKKDGLFNRRHWDTPTSTPERTGPDTPASTPRERGRTPSSKRQPYAQESRP